MTAPLPDSAFWAGRRVLVTGHTGFKGAWLCLLLNHLGAQVSGFALPAPAGGAYAAMRPRVDGDLADIRDAAAVAATVRHLRPEIVFHLAAQPLVGEGHARPLETFATNVMGTAHVLEALVLEALHNAPAAVALVVSLPLRWLLERTGAYRLVWHRGLFDIALVVLLWAGVAAGATGLHLSA